MNRKTKILISLDGKQTDGEVCSRQNVLEDLKRESANIAKGSEVFEYQALESRDSKMLEVWLHDAAMSIVSALDRYVMDYYVSRSEGIKLSLSIPAQAKRDVEQAIADAGADFVGSMLLTKWLTIHKPEAAEVYVSRAAEQLTKLVTIADERRRAMYYEL